VSREAIADATAHARAAVEILSVAIRTERDVTIRSPMLDARDGISLAMVQLEVAGQFVRQDAASEVRS